MRTKFMTILTAGFAGSLLMAFVATAASINVKTKAGVGEYLTDDKGMTLYLFKKDAPNKSVCGAGNGCIEKWPVFFVDKVEPSTPLNPADFGTITRDDGKKQTTYKGQPLYYYAKDKDGDDIYGQGVNNIWFVVAP